MTIRNGIYAEYENLDLKLVEVRSEVPVSDDKKTFQLWYLNSNDCPFEDFKKSRLGNGYYKTISISKVEKVFLVTTHGQYKEFNVEVFNGKEDKLRIACRDIAVAEKLNMTRVGKKWYNKEVEISDLDLIWEEKIEIKKTKILYGELLKLNEIWQDKRGQRK